MAWSALVIVGCVLFIDANRSDLAGAFANSPRLAGWPLVAGVGLSSAAMLNRAGKSRASHRAVGLSVPRWSMLTPTLIGFSADKIVRIGGLGGLAVMLRHGDRMGYPKGAVVASTVVAKVANFASLGLFLVAAVGLVWWDGELDGWWLAAIGGFVVYAAAIGGASLAASRNRSRAERWWAAVERRAPRLCSAVGPRPVFTVWEGLGNARASPTWTANVVVHAVAAKALGVGLLVVASHAVELPIPVSDALVVYSTVLLTSIVSMMPGGIGAVEASAVAVIVGTGTPVIDAVATVALFRVFDLWLPLVIGGGMAAVGRLRTRVDSPAELDELSLQQVAGPTNPPAPASVP